MYNGLSIIVGNKEEKHSVLIRTKSLFKTFQNKLKKYLLTWRYNLIGKIILYCVFRKAMTKL